MATHRSASALALLLVLAACGPSAAPGDAGPPPDAYVEPPLEPDLVCPGGPGCPAGGDGVLHAGAAALEITPDLRAAETFTDLDGNGEWDARTEPFDDRDGDGIFDGVWIAGFGVGRAATAVHDPQWASAVALRVDETTIAFVSLDVVGWFLDDILLIREEVARAGIDVDFVIVGATHCHESRDTIGIWGPSISQTGLDPAYQAFVRDQSVAAVRAAVAALEPANIQYASALLRDMDSPSDVNRYVGDNRDPIVLDDEIRILRFVRAGTGTAGDPGSGETISTLVNFASHPEYTGSRNTELSSDWPHWMRMAIQDGIPAGPDGTPVAPVGGVTVFLNGALGSQIGPNRLHVRRWDGTPVLDEDSRESAETVGTQIGYFVLQALRGGGTVIEETATLGFRRAQFFAAVENRRYHIAGQQGLFMRALYHYDPERTITRNNLPDVLTEIALVDVGDATMLTIPGELDPAEWLGGYEAPCEWTPGGCEALIDETDTNPPDISRAPEGPFLRDHLRMRRPEATQFWALGLTNDFLGYFLPDFDYQLHSVLPYIDEAPGDHYEETNSIGPAGWPRIRGKMIELIEWSP